MSVSRTRAAMMRSRRASSATTVAASQDGAASRRKGATMPPWPVPAEAAMRPPPRAKLPSLGMMRCDHGVGAFSRAR